jgi:hypothetical protein
MPSGRGKRAKKAACYFADALTYVWTAIQLIGAFFFFKTHVDRGIAGRV